MIQREYKKVKLKDIVPYPRNNKIHWKNIDDIVRSIQANTYIAPIIIDEKNVIIAWHGRKLALDKLWVEEVEVLIISWLSESQKRDYRIRDNKLSELSEWDFDNLNFELEELNIPELSALFWEEKWSEDFDENKEDDVAEVAADIYVQKWDIFKLWDHTLMCWDSMNEEDIQNLIQWINDKVTHCISDPPYWIAYKPDNHEMIENDDKILDYIELWKKYSSWFFCMWTGYQVVETWIELVKRSFWKLTNMVIRHKGGGWMWDTDKSLSQDFEILLVNHRWNSLQWWYRGNSVWMYNQEEKSEFVKKGKKEEFQNILQNEIQWTTLRKVKKDSNTSYMHPTQKPVEINERVLENFTGLWDNVLDLFWWSWSNLLACEKQKRVCYMMEIDPGYIQVIISRFHTVTMWWKPIECINRDLDINLILNGKTE